MNKRITFVWTGNWHSDSKACVTTLSFFPMYYLDETKTWPEGYVHTKTLFPNNFWHLFYSFCWKAFFISFNTQKQSNLKCRKIFNHRDFVVLMVWCSLYPAREQTPIYTVCCNTLPSIFLIYVLFRLQAKFSFILMSL